MDHMNDTVDLNDLNNTNDMDALDESGDVEVSAPNLELPGGITVQFAPDSQNSCCARESTYFGFFAGLAKELERGRNEDRKIMLRPECSYGNFQQGTFS